MNLQEAISELEKGHRTYRAFEMVLEIIKKAQSAENDIKASNLELGKIKIEITNCNAKYAEAQKNIQDATEKAKSIIEDAITDANTKAEKIIAQAREQEQEILIKKIEAQKQTKAAQDKFNDIVIGKEAAQKELDEINAQIDVLRGNLKRLVG